MIALCLWPVVLKCDGLRFLHVPKTGGTAIRHAMPHNVESHREPCTVAHTPIQWLSLATRRRSYDNTTSFTVMRHPYDRAISQYKFMCWANPHELERLGYRLNACQQNTTQLNNFIHKWTAFYSMKAHANVFDCHFVPQSTYAIAADAVFCNISAASAFIRQCGVNAPHLRREIGYNWTHYLDNKSRRILRRVYKKDFEHCQYAFRG